MSTPIAATSASLSSTAGTISANGGVVTYAEATGGLLSLYDGSTSGNLLLTCISSGRVPLTVPVRFSSTAGLYYTLSAGTAVVHYG